jgi:membrane protein required for colicin V production
MNGVLSINSFDLAVYVCLALAVVMGFSAGLLRSLATIFGYLVAAPLAVAAAPTLTPILIDQFRLPATQAWVALAGIFLAIGIVISALLRHAVNEIVGENISIPDRLAGALLGAVRIGLLAVLMVVIFDRIIPADREPAFLQGSQLRPILSQAGQAGLKSLPPDVVDFIDRLKRERGI